MSFDIGTRVRVRDTHYVGTITGMFTGSRSIGLYRVHSPAEADPRFLLWYEVELDEPHYDGQWMYGYNGKVFRELHTEDVLALL